jgi:hypothetical protein
MPIDELVLLSKLSLADGYAYSFVLGLGWHFLQNFFYFRGFPSNAFLNQ